MLAVAALAFALPSQAEASRAHCRLGHPTLKTSQTHVGQQQAILLRGRSGSRKPATIEQRVHGRWLRQSRATPARRNRFSAEIFPQPTSGRSYVLRARERTTGSVKRDSGCRWSFSRRVRVAKGAPYDQLRGVTMPNYLKQSPAETDQDLADAAALGSDVVRFGISWQYLEQQRGVFAADQIVAIDHLMETAGSLGLKVIATVGSTPCWALADRLPSEPCWPYPPTSPQDFRSFVDFLVTRWGDSLAGVEVWSEPNFDRFFRGDAASYAALVEQAALGVDDSPYPNLPLIAGGLLFSDVEYLRQLYELGLAQWTDAISVHPYDIHDQFGDPTQQWPEDGAERSFISGIPRLHDVMLEYGDRSPIWITEFGYASCPATPLCVDPELQSQWLAAGIRQAAQWSYVRGITIFTLHDSGQDDYWEGRFGLYDVDGAPKPAFFGVRDAFRTLP